MTFTRERNGVERGDGNVGGSRMPPYDVAAEQGVLGCCLIEPRCVVTCLERFAVEDGHPVREVFFDLRHQVIFEGMLTLYRGDKGVDTITVCGELRNRQQLEQVGGEFYVSSLPDVTPSAANLETYLEVVWEKYVARQALQVTTRIQQVIYEQNGISEGGIARVERQLSDWRELAARSSARVQPQDLKRPGEFGEAVFARWFNEHRDDVPGLDLPFSFPLRIRTHEMTLVCGEDGSGKSIFMGQVAVGLMKQGWKGCIASLEVPSDMTVWMLQRQILGEGPRLAPTEENRRRVGNALAFLDARMWMYDFLGITDWRLLLDVMRYARGTHQVDFFVIDSIMRIGIPEDDLTTQALAASEFAAFTVQTGAHLFMVHHLNKTREGSMKTKATGSKRWSDNANNIVEMQRNAKKKEKLEELRNRKEAGRMSDGDFNTQREELSGMEDGKFLLGKQRFFGTPQNGSKWLWFDERSLQFRDKFSGGIVDYLL